MFIFYFVYLGIDIYFGVVVLNGISGGQSLWFDFTLSLSADDRLLEGDGIADDDGGEELSHEEMQAVSCASSYVLQWNSI